jgi:hypothetical protein
MAERLGEVVTHSRTMPPETDEQVLGRHPNLSRALDRVLATWPQDVPFTASTLAAEITASWKRSGKGDRFRRRCTGGGVMARTVINLSRSCSTPDRADPGSAFRRGRPGR